MTVAELELYEDFVVVDDATLADFHEIDELGPYRGSGNTRTNVGPPIYFRLNVTDTHREDCKIIELEGLEQECQQRTQFTDSGGFDPNPARFVRTRDLESGVSRE